jgi:hypothetical protein
MRGVVAVAGGLAVWIVVVTAGNLAVRAALPRYGEAEAALRAAGVGYVAPQVLMPFTLPMLVARLVLGALSSIVAGAACAWVARSGTRTSWVLGIVLIVIFVPIHVWLWQIFPPWYHLAFLISLLPCTLLGAGFAARSRR